MDKHGYNTYRLAKRLDIHMSTITNWKNGAMPSTEYLIRLAECFGVSMEALLGKEVAKDAKSDASA